MRTLAYRDLSRRIFLGALERDQVIKAQMELTYRCNLRCVHCYTDCFNGPEHFPKELTTAEIVRILDEMADLGILWLNFTGGEVFMRPDFFEIYDDAFEKGFIVTLYTNATLLTPATVERLAQRPPFFLDISCHSVDEEAFDRFTQVRGSFRKFLDGVERVKARGIPFRLKTKAMTWNKAEIPRIKAFVESFGLKFGLTTSMSPRLDGDLSPLSFRLSPGEIGEVEAMQERWSEETEACHGEPGSVPDRIGPPPDRLYRCGCAGNTIHISAWGELGTCTMEYERRASLRTYSLREAMARVYGEVRAIRYRTDSPCRSCQLFAYCEKSPTAFRRQTGDPEPPIRHDCDVALSRAERETRRRLPHPLQQAEHSPTRDR